MEKWTKIKDVMTTSLVKVAPLDSMQKVAEIFNKEDFHHLPVVENEQVVGMLSKSDYLRLLHGFTLFKTNKSNQFNEAVMQSLLVKEVMTKPVVTVDEEDTVQYAAEIFRENYFHALPVVKDGVIKGIITTYDLLLFAFLKEKVLS
jgi:acetoin utilization protein AcuB